MNWTRFFATGLGVGLIPWAPGTFGTLLAVPLVWLAAQSGHFSYMAITIAMVIFAVLMAHLDEMRSKRHDSSEIVIDEVAGFMVAMTWLPNTWQAYLFGFVLFRLFDIWKPFPIRQIDRDMPGGFGVVMDDVAAGLIVNIILQFVYIKTVWLGVQWRGH